ncbi:DsrE family protein [uncultured Desulfosarcina sp.]|uniref:DsrE family protein n=1 Tax=uncultured Desulfosarcina sp. TaxID=218289 RepID=UPI0029C64681|nr:DsrE family protein [uncultured Desulfosarcina sp.]
MKKVALFVFNGDPVCFIHVLLNGLDLKAKGMDGRIIVEGAATALLPKLAQQENPLHKLWEKAKSQGIVEGVCKGCALKMGTMDEAVDQGLALLDDMSGHPSMSRYMEEGFEVISF